MKRVYTIATLLMAVLLSSCNGPAVTSMPLANVTTAAASATTQVADVTPELTLTEWAVSYIPADTTSDLEQRLFALQIQASSPMPSGKGLSLSLELKQGEQTVLTAQSSITDCTFIGLTSFVIVVDFHNYLLSQEQMDSLADVDTVNFTASLMTLSEPIPDDSPLAWQEITKDKITIEKDQYGIRADQLKLGNENYPEIGACVITFDNQEPAMIVPMSPNFSDPASYDGYLSNNLSISDVSSFAICAVGDATVK